MPPSARSCPLQLVCTPRGTGSPFVTPQLICTPQFICAPSNLFAPASLPLPCLCTSWACELTDGYRSTSHPSPGLRARPGLAQASQNPRLGPKPPPRPGLARPRRARLWWLRAFRPGRHIPSCVWAGQKMRKCVAVSLFVGQCGQVGVGDFLMWCRWWLSGTWPVWSWKMNDACRLGKSATSFKHL
jgi:hypothetical protein